MVPESDLDDLTGFLCSPSPQEISQVVAEALVNLSQDAKLADTLINARAFNTVMELLGKVGCSINRLLVTLLVNLNQLESRAIVLLQEGDEKLAGLHVTKLVICFTKFSRNKQGEDAFEHVAAIIVNIIRIRPGRMLILELKRGLLKQILPQIDSRSLVRRQGTFLVTNGDEVTSTSKMHAELATPLSFERDAEEDPQVHIEAAEALYLLALQEGGRRAFWPINGARILQVDCEYEEDPKVMEAYERLDSLLILGVDKLCRNNKEELVEESLVAKQ